MEKEIKFDKRISGMFSKSDFILYQFKKIYFCLFGFNKHRKQLFCLYI